MQNLPVDDPYHFGIKSLYNNRQVVLQTHLSLRLFMPYNSEASNTIMMSTSISYGDGWSSCCPETPGNPTEVDATVSYVSSQSTWTQNCHRW